MSLDDIRSLWWSGRVPSDTWGFISHTWLPLNNQVRGPSLTYRCKETVSKSHLSRWQLKCDFCLLQHMTLFQTCFIFPRMEKKNDIKDRSTRRPWDTIRVTEGREGSALLAIFPTYKGPELCFFLIVLYKSTLRQSYKCSLKKRGFESATKDKAVDLSICNLFAEEKLQHQLKHLVLWLNASVTKSGS